MALSGYLYIRLRKSSRFFQYNHSANGTNVSNLSLAFIQKWQTVELSIRNLISLRLGESAASKPLSLLIKDLRQNQIIDLKDETILRELLDIRNRILHIGYKIDTSTFQAALLNADRLLDKIVSAS